MECLSEELKHHSVYTLYIYIYMRKNAYTFVYMDGFVLK